MMFTATIGVMNDEKIKVEQGTFENSSNQFVRVELPNGLTMFLYSKEKALELAEKLKQAAEEWR